MAITELRFMPNAGQYSFNMKWKNNKIESEVNEGVLP